MPTGDNLELNFDTSNVAGDPNNYSFNAGGTPDAPPEPQQLDPDGLDAYHGIQSDTVFENKVHFDLVLYSEVTGVSPTLTFEYDITDPLVFNHVGMNCVLDLTTNPHDPLRHDLGNVTTDGTYKSTFDYSAPYEYAFIHYGSRVYADLTVDRKDLPHQHNAILIGDYKPVTDGVVFELGSDDITIIPGSGGEIDSLNTDLNFSDNHVIEQSTDLVFAQAEDTIIKGYSWDFAAAFHGTQIFFDLTIERNNLSRDIVVDGNPSGSTVLHDIKHNNTSTDLNIVSDDAYSDYDLELRFDNGILVLPAPFRFEPMANGATVTTVIDNQNKTNYDVNICPVDINPELNIEDHNFFFEEDYLTKVCSEFKFTAHHGANGSTFVAADLLINDIDPEHGSYGDVDLQANPNFTLDFHHGSYAVNPVFTDNPAVTLDGNIHHGSYTDGNLLTISIIRDVDVYHGAGGVNTELETFEPALLDGDAYGGELNEVHLSTAPIIQVEIVPNGHYVDGEFTTYPAIELVGDSHHGSNTEADMVTSKIFDADAYAGSDSVTDLVTAPSSGFGDIDIYHGADTATEMNVTLALYADGYSGATTEDVYLNTSTTLEADAHGGAYGDTDFTDNKPDEFEIDVYHGSDGTFELAQVKALFPRGTHGAYVEGDLTDSPAEELGIDAYNGAVVELDTLEETDFNTHAYHGASTADITMQVAVNFPMEPISHGATAEGDEIKRGTTFECEAFSGDNGYLSNFVVPAGETIRAEAWNGASFVPSLDALVSAHLEFKPIVASQTLYDGWGGTGGLNHCYISSRDLDPYHGDNVIRLGHDPLGIEDKLIVRFDDIGDDPWSFCNGGGMHFEVAFQTNPRFEADAYAGEMIHAYFPIKAMALIGEDVPLDRLYQWEYWAVVVRETFELEEIRYETLGTVWDHPDDYVAFYESYFKADLTTTAFGQYYHGAYADLELVVPRYGWMTALPPMTVGSNAHVLFEPIEYTRFCKGYIVPNGNAVVFEFGLDTEDYDCVKFQGFNGSHMETVLENNWQPQLRVGHGSRCTTWLQTIGIWTLYTGMGSYCHAQFYEEHEYEVEFNAGGFYATVALYEDPIIGAGGETAEIDDLVIPGPAVKWVTETDCLPNQYVPLTKDGDPDLEAMKPDEYGVTDYPDVPVEYKPYLTRLLATCITYVDGQGED